MNCENSPATPLGRKIVAKMNSAPSANSQYSGSSPVVRDYQQRMTEAGEKAFDFSSFEGYLTARVLVEGLRRAGRTPTRESLIAGLETLRDLNFGGFTVNYTPKDHQGSSFTDLTMIGRDGKFMH